MVNYPNGKRLKENKDVEYGHRGMSLEDDINDTNKFYLQMDRAAVYKKPTPVRIVSVDYKSRATAKITEAYFQVPSTTDYNGVYKSLYLDFEAKETHAKTSMPLQIIHPHQLEHMAKVIKYGGIAFIIIRFVEYDETYFVFASKVLNFIKTESRRSLPYQWVKDNGTLMPFKLGAKVDYLKVIDEFLERK